MNYTLRVLILVLPLFLSHNVYAAAAASGAGGGITADVEIIIRDFRTGVRYVRTSLEEHIVDEEGSSYLPPTVPPVTEMDPAGGAAEAGEVHDELEMPTHSTSLESAPEIVLGRLFKKQDGREPVDNPARNILYRVQAQLDIRVEEKTLRGSGAFGGSGTLVGPRHLLTAGHNLYNPESFGGDKWAKTIWVRCALEGNSVPFDQIRVIRAYTYTQWIRQGDYKEEYDIALFVLERPVDRLERKAGWFGLAYLPDSSPLLEGEFKIAGYPKEVKIENTLFRDTPESNHFAKMWQMSNRNSSGDIVPLTTAPGKFYYQIDTSAGQSGSAIWYVQEEAGGAAAAGEEVRRPYVVGVHAYGEKTEVGRGNYGVRLTKSKFDQIMRWIEDTYEVEYIPIAPAAMVVAAAENIEDQYRRLERFPSNVLEAKISRGEDLPAAYGVMAERLLYGRHNQKINKRRAFEYATKAYESEDILATFFLARMYIDGDAPGERNYERYRELNIIYSDELRELATRKYAPRSQFYLAMINIQENREGDRLLRSSANQKYVFAQLFLGGRLINVPTNKEEGLRYLRLAVDKGNAMAELVYSSVVGEKQLDEITAFNEEMKYTGMSAEGGFSPAQYKLGKIYERLFEKNPKTIPSNRVVAIKYYRLAAKQGHKEAIEALERLGVPIEEEATAAAAAAASSGTS